MDQIKVALVNMYGVRTITFFFDKSVDVNVREIVLPDGTKTNIVEGHMLQSALKAIESVYSNCEFGKSRNMWTRLSIAYDEVLNQEKRYNNFWAFSYYTGDKFTEGLQMEVKLTKDSKVYGIVHVFNNPIQRTVKHLTSSCEVFVQQGPSASFVGLLRPQTYYSKEHKVYYSNYDDVIAALRSLYDWFALGRVIIVDTNSKSQVPSITMTNEQWGQNKCPFKVWLDVFHDEARIQVYTSVCRSVAFLTQLAKAARVYAYYTPGCLKFERSKFDLQTTADVHAELAYDKDVLLQAFFRTPNNPFHVMKELGDSWFRLANLNARKPADSHIYVRETDRTWFADNTIFNHVMLVREYLGIKDSTLEDYNELGLQLNFKWKCFLCKKDYSYSCKRCLTAECREYENSTQPYVPLAIGCGIVDYEKVSYPTNSDIALEWLNQNGADILKQSLTDYIYEIEIKVYNPFHLPNVLVSTNMVLLPTKVNLAAHQLIHYYMDLHPDAAYSGEVYLMIEFPKESGQETTYVALNSAYTFEYNVEAILAKDCKLSLFCLKSIRAEKLHGKTTFENMPFACKYEKAFVDAVVVKEYNTTGKLLQRLNLAKHQQLFYDPRIGKSNRSTQRMSDEDHYYHYFKYPLYLAVMRVVPNDLLIDPKHYNRFVIVSWFDCAVPIKNPLRLKRTCNVFNANDLCKDVIVTTGKLSALYAMLNSRIAEPEKMIVRLKFLILFEIYIALCYSCIVHVKEGHDGGLDKLIEYVDLSTKGVIKSARVNAAIGNPFSTIQYF